MNNVLQKHKMRRNTNINGGINEVILTSYICLVLVSFIDVYVIDNFIVILLIILPLFFIVYYLSCLTTMKIQSVGFVSNKKYMNELRTSAFWTGFLFSLLVLLIWYIAFFPGTFGYDPVDQFYQAISGEYSNWHPAIHTLIFFTLPLKISHGRAWSVILFQIILFSLAMGYMTKVLYVHAGKKFAIISILFIILNPFTDFLVISAQKDVAFALDAMVAMTLVADILYGEDSVNEKHKQIALIKCVSVGGLLALATLFRHNGILFTAVLIIGLFFVFDIRKWIVSIAAFLITLIVIMGPVYSFFEVDMKGTSDVMQVSLTPLTVISNVVYETPELLDSETSQFVYSIAPQEEWEKWHELGNFSVIRYYADIDTKPIEEAGVINIWKMALKCFVHSPRASFKAFFALTDIVYGLDIKDEGWPGFGVVDNSLGIESKGVTWMRDLLILYYKIVRFHGLNFFRQTAFALFAMLAVILSRCDLSKREDWKTISICLPIFAYNFGTMFLLGGPTLRFFFITTTVCPIVILIVMRSGQRAYLMSGEYGKASN